MFHEGPHNPDSPLPEDRGPWTIKVCSSCGKTDTECDWFGDDDGRFREIEVVPLSDTNHLREALREDREKWSFDTLLFVADQLLAEVYPTDIFPPDERLDDRDPGPYLVDALRRCRAALNTEESK